MKKNTFFEVCNEIAQEQNVRFRANDFEEKYGWFGGSFEVDAFGGVAAIVMHNAKGWHLNEKPATISEIFAALPSLIADEFEARKNVNVNEYNYD